MISSLNVEIGINITPPSTIVADLLYNAPWIRPQNSYLRSISSFKSQISWVFYRLIWFDFKIRTILVLVTFNKWDIFRNEYFWFSATDYITSVATFYFSTHARCFFLIFLFFQYLQNTSIYVLHVWLMWNVLLNY